MAQTPAGGSGLPPVTIADLTQALNATEANVRWWEGDGTLPKAERDAHGNVLWDVRTLQEWSRTDAAQKFIARRI